MKSLMFCDSDAGVARLDSDSRATPATHAILCMSAIAVELRLGQLRGSGVGSGGSGTLCIG